MDDLIVTPKNVILQSVEVRLIFPEERARWNDLMRQHHYLGFHSLIGESLRYIAVYQTDWLALIGWAAPALKCGVRDQWIGWPDTIKNIRLPLIANNSRFLILPHARNFTHNPRTTLVSRHSPSKNLHHCHYNMRPYLQCANLCRYCRVCQKRFSLYAKMITMPKK